MATTTNLGKVAVTPKGAWSSSSTYKKLDIVTNGGGAYLALKDVPANTLLTNTEYWLVLVEKGDKGDTGEISGASASISGTYGTPSVSVTAGGTSTDRSFVFAFSNLVGNGIASVSCEKTGTSGAVDTYTLTITENDGTENEFELTVTNGSVTSVNGRTGAVTGLAEEDGYYDEMSVGSAEQLISSTYEEDSVPYVFRTSGGSIDIGDREFDEIHGGTVAFNQISKINSIVWTGYHDVTFTKISDTTIKASGVCSANSQARIYNAPKVFPPNHVYLIDGFDSNIKAVIGNSTPQITPTLAKPTTSTEASVIGIIQTGVDFGDGVEMTPQIFDLTQMFGSAIADYIYGLEQANEGAGVTWFKSLFPKPYYAYNAGTLISVTGLSAHKMVGFNQWDEEWEEGTFNTTTGANITKSGQIRSKNIIPILPNTTYYWNCTLYNWVILYDADGNVVPTPTITDSGSASRSGNSFSVSAKHIFTTPSNAYGMRFYIGDAYGGTYKNNISINIHWDGERDGEYEEYTEHSYPLDSSLTLRGIPKLDADNKLYYDGDVYQSDGTVQRRYAEVDLGTLNWIADSSRTGVFYTNGINSLAKGNGAIISSKYSWRNLGVPSASSIASYDKLISLNISYGGGTIYLIDHAFDSYTGAQVKTALSGVYAVYELKGTAQTTESAEPYVPVQWVSDWGTEEYVIAEQSGVALPVGHKTRYSANLKAKLEMAPDSPSGNGDWVVRQANGHNTYVPLVIPNELPSNPSEDGTYLLKATVASGTTTLSWEVQS